MRDFAAVIAARLKADPALAKAVEAELKTLRAGLKDPKSGSGTKWSKNGRRN